MEPFDSERKALEKVLNNSEFADSPVLRNLLIYLVKCYHNNSTPKETAIAIDVFGKDSSFNPAEDTIVRVNTHNLRHKLEHYYKGKGRRDKLQIVIPKGHYAVKFERVRRSPFYVDRTRKTVLTALLFIFAVAMTFILTRTFGSQGPKNNPFSPMSANHFIWGDFINEDKPTLIVLGDFYFLRYFDEETQRGFRIRDILINNETELEKFKQRYPEYKSLQRDTENSFVHKDQVFAYSRILPIFLAHGITPGIRLVSQLPSHELLNNNIVFLGNFKNIGIFKSFFKHSHFAYQLTASTPRANPRDPFKLYSDQKIFYDADDDTTVITYDRIGSVYHSHTDYSIVSKFPGPNNNTIMLFVSFYSAGISQAVDLFSSTEKLAMIKERMQALSQDSTRFFEILFETTGYNRTGLTTTIKHFHPIDPELNFWSLLD
ncbi:hypothetical protein GF406_07365 [candidate division KSB1 bacterium]|nr:hypothetical protein [candidate division KSB1 bacterium]